LPKRPAPSAGSVLVWIADILPNGVADKFATMIEGGASVIKRTLESERAGT
jgi:hypothetical protein